MADEHCKECPECGSFVTSTAQQCGASCGRLEELRAQLTAANARAAELEAKLAASGCDMCSDKENDDG